MIVDTEAKSSINDAFALAFPESVKERFILMLYLYLDESGTHGDAGNLCVAGYLAKEEQWKHVESEWHACMVAWKIPFYHMTDSLAGRKQFKDWPADKKLYRLNKLIGIINKHVMVSVGCMIPMRTFHSVAARHPLVTGSAYHFACVGTFAQASKSLDALGVPRPEPIAYVMAAGAPGCDEVHKSFLAAFNNERLRAQFRLHSIMSADAQRVTPLQAADILANTLYRQLPRYLTGKASATDEINRLARLKNKPAWQRFTEHDLEGAMQDIERTRIRRG